MKKLLFFAAALLVLVACDNQGNNAPERTPFKKGQQVTLTVGSANQGSQAPARTMSGARNDNNIAFKWEEGDKILVKVGDKTAEFTLNSEPGLNSGDFTGTMPADGSTFDIQYPTETPDLSAQVYTAEKTIPADKMLFKATNCTLAEDAILVAQNAMVQLNLYGTDKTVGKIVFSNKTASPAVSYTLTCTGGKTIGTASTAATPFYMVVPAGEYKFEVEVWDAATTPAMICSFATSEAKTFVAGECMNMPAKEVAPTRKMVNGHEAVQLWENGPFWATMNVGATKAEESGDYFAWGETEPKENYSGSTYTYTDNPATLPADHDAAAVKWGGAWRMATYAEWDELKTKCTWAWNPLNGINGYEVEGPNKNTIFLPASGYRSSTLTSGFGRYWSSSLYENDSRAAYCLNFFSLEVNLYNVFRYYGQSVRPVCQ